MARNRPTIPSAEQYKAAFEAIHDDIQQLHFEMLRFHYAAPNHTISIAELAKAVGHKKAFLEYGRLGGLLCKQIGFQPTMIANGKPIFTQVLADAPAQRSSASWEWTLRPQVVHALEKLGWVKRVNPPRAFVLTWNPESKLDGFPWDDDDDNVDWYIRQTAKGKQPPYSWSTGNTKGIKPGDRLYLFRQGSQRGLVGSAHATSDVIPGSDGGRRLFVELKFDAVVSVEEMLPIAELQDENYGVNWGWLPASGVSVPAESAIQLERLWRKHLVRVGRSFSEAAIVSPPRRKNSGLDAGTDDEVERVLRQIVQRRGQPAFREVLLAVYDGRCAITGCNAKAALEAAHIEPYSGPSSNKVPNGLLLRSDIHTLFDLGLIAISPVDLTIALTNELLATDYEDLKGRRLRLPKGRTYRPDKDALKRRWEEFGRHMAMP